MSEVKEKIVVEENGGPKARPLDQSLKLEDKATTPAPGSDGARKGTAWQETSGESLHPLIELTRTRMREFLREKEAVFWVFVFPVLLAFALGIAFRNTAPQKLPVAIENNSQAAGPTASDIASALAHSPDITPLIMSPAEAAQALRSGKVALVVRAANHSNAGQPSTDVGPTSGSTAGAQAALPALDYRFDPTRPESRTARLMVDDALQRAMGRSDVVRASDEKVTEPGGRYIDFLIPGLIGLNLMGSGMWGLGFSVVMARTRKLLKRFAATPMRRTHYLLSFMLSRLIFLALEVVAVLGFGWLMFGVVVRGSFSTLAFISLIGGLAFSGIGLLVASRPETIEGVSGLMNLVMLPMWLLSGTFFSAERFPQAFQPFIKALPLTALNSSLRAVINDGASLASNWSQICVLLVWGGLSFIIALRIFRWK